ncbi:hypothetical protein A2300_04025 [Candidatus Falkowbacteria bacterium RIFOXYB2_FULL_35_7]|uniref:RNA polymerase sigma factor 70 region 4 type 2 domain-containing protein n=1 Tax=Candidatus Falkowbacteria bacterium RIFOXYC2_FULL_36_12 TaxID=1798002 RepID=A0A1F5T0Z6_9BACT|nr:MAG: hypothetical protein A2300_04025 [Candidatus Falkowbacteria bacterium RIFOXYB2_FULL_35_7]OGF32608.1 MAG: hypothetical protein A2478_00095 [Candidatus Falkowbacteria bacterium RIFOXYC2_FULL_36_12]
MQHNYKQDIYLEAQMRAMEGKKEGLEDFYSGVDTLIERVLSLLLSNKQKAIYCYRMQSEPVSYSVIAKELKDTPSKIKFEFKKINKKLKNFRAFLDSMK